MKKLLLAVFVAVSTYSSLGDTLAQWTFESSAPAVAYTPGAGVTTTNFFAEGGSQAGSASAVGLHAAAAAAYSGPAGNASAKSLSANNWTVGDYWQLSLSTVGSSSLSLSFDQAGSSTGPKDFILSYSLDGTSFNTVGSYTVAASTWNTTAMAGFTHTFDLGSSIDDSPTVYLRLTDADTTSIGGSTVGTGGTDRIDNVSVFTTPVPEPSSAVFGILGGAIGLIWWRRRK